MSKKKPGRAILNFIIDYCERHAHPVNAALHIIGVPMAFYGFYKLFSDPPEGLGMLFSGYLFQYLGHRAQGNEVGEVTLAKKVWSRLRSS
jgi:hypothetical protein